MKQIILISSLIVSSLLLIAEENVTITVKNTCDKTAIFCHSGNSSNKNNCSVSVTVQPSKSKTITVKVGSGLKVQSRPGGTYKYIGEVEYKGQVFKTQNCD